MQREQPLLRTKLDVPLPHTHTLTRERLLALIPYAPETRLLLLCAPAGFGKTTLLATWCRTLRATRTTAVAWLALDETDNDPQRFLAYLVTALAQALTSDNQHTATPVLIEAVDTSIEAVLTSLINRIAALDRNLVLALDDYHLMSTPAIHTAVAFLLDHLPDRACLAISSRADPPLPLARLRAREQLIELRAADLRFTPDEVQAFCIANQLALTPADAQVIGTYVEGWPAGVQLMALALRATAHTWAAESEAVPAAAHISQVLGCLNESQQHVFAYLADDVFARQPAHRKAFLLQTAILDRMCGPLCDAILGLEPADLACRQTPTHAPDSYSRLVLEEIERANLFVMPLDSKRDWYRYHHLFRAFLCAQLNRESPLAVIELHRRASTWYEQHQLLPAAVDHALAAGELERAAILIEPLAGALLERGEYATLQCWLKQLPDQFLAMKPELCVSAAWAALLAGEIGRIEPLLQYAKSGDAPTQATDSSGAIAHLQSHLARLRLDPTQTIAAAQHALAQLPAEEWALRSGSLLALGAGQLIAGDLEQASSTLSDAYAQCQTHNFLGSLVVRCCLGDLAAQRGQLQAAATHYQQVLDIAGSRSVGERYVALARLGDLARERNDLHQAQQLLQSALKPAEHAGVAVYLQAGYIALARTQQAQGEYTDAQQTLERALHVAQQLGSLAYSRQLRAEQARLALAQGDLKSAQAWQQGLPSQLEGTCDITDAIEACMRVRVQIAQQRSGQGVTPMLLLARLREQAQVQGRTEMLTELLTLEALATAANGHHNQAIRVLQQALLLAMPAGYMRLFLDEGAQMALLLAECRIQLTQHKHDLANEQIDQLLRYLNNLLAAVGRTGLMQQAQVLQCDCRDTIVEPLSEREREVLQLIARGASNQAIAQALVISIGTVKSHINHILGKLTARNRTEAVSRAREHGLLTQ